MIDKQAQDQAWAVLTACQRQCARNIYRTSHDGNVEWILETLYGKHNLTSDAEGEEEPKSKCNDKKINGIIVDGQVHVAVPDVDCQCCSLESFCNSFEDFTGYALCYAADTHHNSGYSYSKELTDKINKT